MTKRSHSTAPRPVLSWLAPCLLLLVGLLAGCEDTVQPIIGEDRPYTLWGLLDAAADTQKVRVFTIEQRLGLDRPGPIDAEVKTINLTTGEEHLWTHRKAVFDDGSTGDVFWAAFTPDHGESFRLEVWRSDGQLSTATVTIPPPVTLERTDPDARQRFEVKIDASVPSLVQVAMRYDLTTMPPANPWPPGSLKTLPIRVFVDVPYTDRMELRGDHWFTQVDMHEDFQAIQDNFALNCLRDDLIAFRRVEFRFLAADEAWTPPNGVFDPDILSEPGTFSNIENGFGFFGAGFTVIDRWLPADADLLRLGFSISPPCPMMPANLPECQVPPEPCFD